MKILIITPKIRPIISGNTITAERICEALKELGHDCRICLPSEYHIDDFKPDVVHLLHAFKAYRDDIKEPFIITLTGTDLNKYGHDDPDLFKDHLNHAQAVTLLKEEDRTAIEKMHPNVFVVPQAVTHGDIPIDLREEFDIEGKIILLPSGFREVKDPLYAVNETEGLDATLLILGENYNDDIYERADRQWVRRGKIRHQQMRAAYEQSDIILNTSDSEGQSNAVLEALSLNRCVLASDIPGNRIVPEKYRFKKEPGMLRELLIKYLTSSECPDHKIKIPTPKEEAKMYLDVYKNILSPEKPPREDCNENT